MGNRTEANGCDESEVVEDYIFQSNWFKEVKTFEELNLDKDLLAGVVYDFKKPFLVQQRAIKPCIDAHDVIIEAPTGSGKTTAAVISLLHRIDINVEECQALVLVPDSESARAIQTLMSILSDHSSNFRCHVCDDERSTVEERRLYNLGVHVLIGTPANVLRLFTDDSDGKKNKIQVAVLDRVDELLVETHKSQIYDLFGSHLCLCSQIIVLSTTLPKELKTFKDDFMNETIQIILRKYDFFSFDGVTQFYLNFENDANKFNLLNSLRDTFSCVRVIIFCNSRRNVDKITQHAARSGQPVLSTHVEPMVRKQVFTHFLAGSCNVLVTTDYLMYGLNLPKSVVINYDLPHNPATYSSRLGHEFGCARNLLVFNFVSDTTRAHLTKIEQFYNTNISLMPKDCRPYLKDLHVINEIPILKCDFLSFSQRHSSVELKNHNKLNGDELEESLSPKRRKTTPDGQSVTNESALEQIRNLRSYKPMADK